MPTPDEIHEADRLERELRDTEARLGIRMIYVSLPDRTERGKYLLAKAEIDAQGEFVFPGIWLCPPGYEEVFQALKLRVFLSRQWRRSRG